MIWLDSSSYIESSGCMRFLLFLFTLKFELLIPESTLTDSELLQLLYT